MSFMQNTQTKQNRDEKVAQEYLEEIYPGTIIKYLWNIENSYRFRINRFSNSELLTSQFIIVNIDDKITHQIKDD